MFCVIEEVEEYTVNRGRGTLIYFVHSGRRLGIR